jgi:hypothetical protein
MIINQALILAIPAVGVIAVELLIVTELHKTSTCCALTELTDWLVRCCQSYEWNKIKQSRGNLLQSNTSARVEAFNNVHRCNRCLSVNWSEMELLTLIWCCTYKKKHEA